MTSLEPITLSLKIAVISTIIVLLTGLAAAWFMTRFRFPGKSLVESTLTLPLVLPPTVIGFALLLSLGRFGPLGRLIYSATHRQVVFTWFAAVIASVVVSFPLLYRSAKSALENVDEKLELAARTLGASEKRVFFTVSLPLARYGILSGLIMAFARALGEFGATLMLAGNIPGKTQTMPMAVYFALESGDQKQALFYVLVMTVLSFLAVALVNRWSARGASPAPKRKEREVRNAATVHTKRATGF